MEAHCSISREVEEIRSNKRFRLHTHEYYEIYCLHEGDCEHVVEGAVYDLSPMDLILLRPDEMHRVYHRSFGRYDRTILSIEEAFFTEHQCEDYRKVFWGRRIGEQNKIDASVVQKSGIADCLSRLASYSAGSRLCREPAAQAAFCELLYLLNTVAAFSQNASESKVREIITYINESFREPISLEEVADRFFLSKAHLCRLFKKMTGFTVNGYIRRKRLMLVRELYRTGMNLSSACQEAGFGDYSAFYKAYRQDYGVSPREGLRP